MTRIGIVLVCFVGLGSGCVSSNPRYHGNESATRRVEYDRNGKVISSSEEVNTESAGDTFRKFFDGIVHVEVRGSAYADDGYYYGSAWRWCGGCHGWYHGPHRCHGGYYGPARRPCRRR